MGLTVSLSRMLQSVNLDFREAMKDLEDIKQTLVDWRSKNTEWNEDELSVFRQSEKLARIAGVSLSLPGCISRSVYGPSYDGTMSEEQYFKEVTISPAAGYRSVRLTLR